MLIRGQGGEVTGGYEDGEPPLRGMTRMKNVQDADGDSNLHLGADSVHLSVWQLTSQLGFMRRSNIGVSNTSVWNL